MKPTPSGTTVSMVRGLLARVFGTPPEKVATVHDFTYDFSKDGVSLVKPVDDGTRAFLMGTGLGIAVGDLVVVKGQVRQHMGTKLQYRIQKVSYNDVTWRAYGVLEQSGEAEVVSDREKRFNAWKHRRT